MSELLAAGKDLKNLSTAFSPLKADGTAEVLMSGDGYKPELRCTAAEVEAVVKAWTPKPAPPAPKPEPTPTPPAPTPSTGLILGATNATADGEAQAKLFHEAGIRADRLGLTGSSWQYATLAQAVGWGYRNNLVIVGNVGDSEPLGKVDISSWAKTLAEGVEQEILPTLKSTPTAVKALICGNEMYAKTAKGWSTEGSEPAVYAAMYLAALEALAAIGCPVPLLCNSYGIVEPSGQGDVQWLEALVKAEPSIVSKAQGFNSHPYGRAGEDGYGNTAGTGALEAQHALAVKLGFELTAYHVDEVGFAIDPAGKEARYVKSEAEQAEQLKLYVEAVEKMSFAEAFIYFQALDFDKTIEDTYGLLNDSWEPRPSFTVYSELCKAAA